MEENIESMQDDPIGIKIMLKCQVSCFGLGGSMPFSHARGGEWGQIDSLSQNALTAPVRTILSHKPQPC